MNSFSKAAAKIINFIHIGFVVLAMFLLIGMTLVISTNVFMRYVLNSGIFWAEEIAKLAVVWFTFISMAVGVKQNLHISINLLPKNMPAWFNVSLDILKDLLVLVLGVVLLIYGNKLIGFTSTSIMPATRMPSSMLYMILPFSGALICLEALLDLFRMDDGAAEVEKFLLGGDHHA